MMRLARTQASPVISSRVDFSRARADMHSLMRSAEVWTMLTGAFAICTIFVIVMGAVDAYAPRHPWLIIPVGIAWAASVFALPRMMQAYARRVRARTMIRCVHCGAPLLGPDAGNLIARSGEDPRSDQVWRTGRCPDCRRKLFDVPPPDNLTANVRPGVSTRPAAPRRPAAGRPTGLE